MRRIKLKKLILPGIYLGIVLNVVGISYWVNEVNMYQDEIDGLVMQLDTLKRKKRALHRRLDYWMTQLADQPTHRLHEIEIVLPIATAAIRDRAVDRGIALNNLRLGSIGGMVGGDIRSSMARPYGKEEQLMSVEAEVQVSWDAVDQFMSWLEDLQKIPVIINKVTFSDASAIVNLKILGK